MTFTNLLTTNHTNPPFKEISHPARICCVRDIDVHNINETFRRSLEEFKHKGQPVRELWPVLLSPVQFARPETIRLLLSEGPVTNVTYIRQAIKTKLKDVFHTFDSI